VFQSEIDLQETFTTEFDEIEKEVTESKLTKKLKLMKVKNFLTNFPTGTRKTIDTDLNITESPLGCPRKKLMNAELLQRVTEQMAILEGHYNPKEFGGFSVSQKTFVRQAYYDFYYLMYKHPKNKNTQARMNKYIENKTASIKQSLRRESSKPYLDGNGKKKVGLDF
jgi:hypothetical protein